MLFTKQMGRWAVVVMVGVVLFAAAGLIPAAAEAAPFDVNRLVVCKDIQDREPVEISDRFSSDTTKVYAFLEAVDIPADTEIDFVWHHSGNEMVRVTVPVRQSGRWRTWANKNLYGLTGSWRVEVQDADGAVIGAVEFEVK